jgi:hypothetical protein
MMRDVSSNVPLHPVSPFGALVMRVVQGISARWTPRGLPRLVWLVRRFVVGTGMGIIWYQKRFRIICDCDSYYRREATQQLVC